MSHPIPKAVRRVRLSYPALLNLSSISTEYPSGGGQTRDIIQYAPTDAPPQSRLPPPVRETDRLVELRIG